MEQSGTANRSPKIKTQQNINKIKLLCYPRIFGYVFNPLSIFYCYNNNKELKVILYEVKNTFNEQHTYIFPVDKSNKIIKQFCNKKFYVSPFMEMETAYNLNRGGIVVNTSEGKLLYYITII